MGTAGLRHFFILLYVREHIGIIPRFYNASQKRPPGLGTRRTQKVSYVRCQGEGGEDPEMRRPYFHPYHYHYQHHHYHCFLAATRLDAWSAPLTNGHPQPSSGIASRHRLHSFFFFPALRAPSPAPPTSASSAFSNILDAISKYSPPNTNPTLLHCHPSKTWPNL